MTNSDESQVELYREISELWRRKRELGREMEALRQEDLQIGKRLFERECSFTEAVQAEAKAALSSIVDMMHTRLPRELRNMIYGFVCLQSRPVGLHEGLAHGHRWPSGLGSDMNLDNELLEPEVLGEETAGEMLEAYFSLNAFEYHYGKGLGYELESLTGLMDVYDLEYPNDGTLLPFRCVRDLRIHVHELTQDEGPVSDMGLDLPSDEDYSPAQFAMIIFAGVLQRLAIFKNQTNLHVTFVVHTGTWAPPQRSAGVELSDFDELYYRNEERHVVNRLEVIRIYFYTLKHSGVKVTVKLIGPDDLDEQCDDSLAMDITPCFTLSKADWEREEALNSYSNNLEAFAARYVPASLAESHEEEFHKRVWDRWGLRTALPSLNCVTHSGNPFLAS